MTSKEALHHIVDNDYNMVITTNPSQLAYNGLTKKEMVEIIERDLEVLEIIKKNISLCDTTKNFKVVNLLLLEGQDGYDTLKEWLDEKDSYQGSEKE